MSYGGEVRYLANRVFLFLTAMIPLVMLHGDGLVWDVVMLCVYTASYIGWVMLCAEVAYACFARRRVVHRSPCA